MHLWVVKGQFVYGLVDRSISGYAQSISDVEEEIYRDMLTLLISFGEFLHAKVFLFVINLLMNEVNF